MERKCESVLNEDLDLAATSLHDVLLTMKDSTVLITGATGLIGSFLVKLFEKANELYGTRISIIGVVRDVEKALKNQRLKNVRSTDLYSYENLKDEAIHPDYIIHTASPTSSSFFIHSPVETIKSVIRLSEFLFSPNLVLKVKSMVFLSTMEVYGSCNDQIIDEKTYGYLNPLDVRSSYPESKRLMETLCVAYSSEYKVPVKICRLTQCFGPGVDLLTDNRVFAQFLRSVINNQDIVLETEGRTERSYVYLSDAIEAILIVLMRGENGQAYNIANPATYCSIKDMALMLTKHYSIDLKYNIKHNPKYCPEQKINLDVSKLEKLGWKPKFDLETSYRRMITDYLSKKS